MKILESSRPSVSVLDFTLEELTQQIKSALSEFKIEAAYLFGSCAGGKPTAWSDIDLLIVMETQESFLERPRLFVDALDFGVPTDIIVYTPEEFTKLKSENSGFWQTFRDNHLQIL